MKTNVKKLAIVLFALGTVVIGCEKDNEPEPVTPGVTQDQPNKGMMITTFNLHQNTGQPDLINEADKFKGWSFEFLDNGVLTAVNAKGETQNGKWSSKESDGQEAIVIDFGDLAPFNLLNNTWMVAKKSDNYKEFVDKDNSDGVTGNVVFGK